MALDLSGLPGHELVRAGIEDLARGIESEAALLVAIGSPRLRALGIDVPSAPDEPEHRLYRSLAASDPDGAHSRYNALLRRLVSFERALAARGASRRSIETGEVPARQGARSENIGHI